MQAPVSETSTRPRALRQRSKGPGAYAAYRAGALRLEDVAGWSYSADWGRTPRVKSLRELVGAEEARRWSQVARQELTARQALGADLNTLLRLRETRFAELRETPSAEIESVLQGMRAARRLPKLDYHFEQHGAELGAATPDELNTLFVAHIRRQDLRFATAIRGKDGARMWYLVDVDSGLVAQYNATRRRYFSFFRVQDQEQFERNYALSWVEAIRQGEEWTFRHWLN